MREYIISVADPSVWDTLWDELTVDGLGDNFIPTRAVQVLNDRPFNDYQAHFNLTDAEADLIRKDPRIQTIELMTINSALGLHFTMICYHMCAYSNAITQDQTIQHPLIFNL